MGRWRFCRRCAAARRSNVVGFWLLMVMVRHHGGVGGWGGAVSRLFFIGIVTKPQARTLALLDAPRTLEVGGEPARLVRHHQQRDR